ncbi:MAG: hypothetical protein R6W69_15735 [Anaerolineales bacterium]
MTSSDAIFIAGGYGVVGAQLAEMMRQRHPDLPLILAGPNPDKAAGLVTKLTNAQAVSLDMQQAGPLNGLKPRAVIATANDPHDYLLREAVQNGIPYLDITRWTERVKVASLQLTKENLTAPVILSSAWMAGIVALVAASLARSLNTVERIEISVLYSLKDKSGPNSVEYMDRLATPYQVMLNGQLQQVYPYTDPLTVTFPGGYRAKTWRFDSPDQLTLPAAAGASTVTARIAFDDAFSTNLLAFLTRSGIWKMISGKRFASLRRALLYSPGSGAAHEIVIEVTGKTEDGSSRLLTANLVDPRGQTHLTAAGALIQLEYLLGLGSQSAPKPGLYYPEATADFGQAFKTLENLNVSLDIVR